MAPPAVEPSVEVAAAAGRKTRILALAKLAAKISVSVVMLYLVLRTVPLDAVAGILRGIDYTWLAAALALHLAAQIVSALRSRYIAITLGRELPPAVAVRAHFVGLWFNQVFPTSLGGDVVKVAMLKPWLGLSLAVRTAILDRISGLAVLMASIVLLLPWYAGYLADARLTGMLGALAAGSLAVGLLLAWRVGRGSPGWGQRPWAQPVMQLFDNIWRFRSGRPLFEQTWTSLAVHANGIALYALIGQAIGIPADLSMYILAAPLVFLAALIPVSYAGWGLREIGAVWLFGLAGVAPDKALSMSILAGLLGMAAGVPGLLVFLKSGMQTRPTSG